MTNSRVYGNAAPWTFRSDTSKRDYPGRPHRNITRLNTHALIELDSGRESSVYAFPQNDRWEFAHCEFADSHDGVYLGAVNVKFHHNRLDNFQDDGVYLSPVYYRHKLEKVPPAVHIYQNQFTRMLTALVFGGPEPDNPDRVFVYRNVFDLRGKVAAGRPSARRAEGAFSDGHVGGDHGSPPWADLSFYQNTVVAGGARAATMGLLGSSKTGHPRRVFNNVFLHADRLPAFVPPDASADVVEDGNLYWAPGAPVAAAAGFFDKFRTSAGFAASRKLYPPGSTTNSKVGDPQFTEFHAVPQKPADVRPKAGSPAAGAGVVLPAELPDPLRPATGKPDIGALPVATSR